MMCDAAAVVVVLPLLRPRLSRLAWLALMLDGMELAGEAVEEGVMGGGMLGAGSRVVYLWVEWIEGR
jgi:hypothetical protein